MQAGRKPRRLDRGERKLHLALVEVHLGAVRDLVAALAQRYPNREPPMIGLVEDALRHLRDGVRILRRSGARG